MLQASPGGRDKSRPYTGLILVVDRLETEGLLARERSVSDRRGAFAVLTEKGVAAMRKAWPVYAKGIDEHFARYLSEEEVCTITEVFQSILSSAKRQSQLP